MEGGGRRQERRVHVLYFLSRDDKVEQPHLVRVVRRRRLDVVLLRDVKRWLSELRGEGMPDAFAWACKRRYKSGYVWEDLAEDDIITPVSGGEYVLKGSLITHVAAAAAAKPTCSSSSSSSFSTTFSSSAAVGTAWVSPSALNGDPKSARPPETTPAEDLDQNDGDVSPPPRADDDEDDDDDGEEEEEEGCKNEDERRRTPSRPPPPRSDASLRTAGNRSAAAVSRVDPPHAGPSAVRPPPVPVSSSGKIAEEQKSEGEGEETNSCAPCNSAAAGGGRSSRASQMFRSLLRCGASAVETRDSVLRPLNTRRPGEAGASDGKSRGGGGWVPPGNGYQPGEATEEGKARGSRGGGRSRLRSRAGGGAGEQRKKTASAEAHSHRPTAGPHCSQCGREFRPERLHSHMTSCRALKTQKKSMDSGKLPQKAESQRATLSEEAATLLLLTH